MDGLLLRGNYKEGEVLGVFLTMSWIDSRSECVQW
jgi:hypothetical protein